MSLLLPLGLTAVFCSLLLLLLASGLLEQARNRGVAKSLAAVEAMNMSPRRLREHELEQPFSDRVLGPLLQGFVRLGTQFTPADRMQKIRRRLDLAGNPPGWDPERVVGLKGLSGVAGLLLGGLLPPMFGARTLPTAALVAVGGVLGWFIPTMWIYQKGYDRSELIRRGLPDAMDLLTISVEAGLAFDAALVQVARKTEGPLAQEFSRVLQEMQIGTGRSAALRGLAERTDVPELKSFVGSMVQADSLGIPVASVLRVQAKEMRVKRSQLAEERAQKVPVKILFPLIFCIMPSLFIVILGPAVITIATRLRG
ncbi:MAG TPA: type II secretion system F family protein [Kineosporiaceae bacterium]|nr:type II secretion system F family protein [Kineosporiaceae bacterium]